MSWLDAFKWGKAISDNSPLFLLFAAVIHVVHFSVWRLFCLILLGVLVLSLMAAIRFPEVMIIVVIKAMIVLLIKSVLIKSAVVPAISK